MDAGSTGNWGVLFLGGAALFTLWQIWRGWRLGVVRAGLRLAALVGSGLAAWYGGKWAGQVVGLLVPAAAWSVALAVGVVLLFGVYLGLLLLSAILFKRTEHQSSGLVRFLFGFGGGVLGLLTALVFLWGAVSAIRAFGSIQEGMEGGRRTGWMILKEQIEGAGGGDMMRSADPIPESFYVTLGKYSRVMSDPEAAARLFKYPGVVGLVEHPKMQALAENPEIQEAALQGDYFTMLRHPLLLQAATDPDLVQKILDIDFAAAVNFALENPSTPSPAP